MQSDGNSFEGDVVLDCFNMAYWIEDSILDQNMNNKYFWIFIMKTLTLRVIVENAHSMKYNT